MQSNYRKLVEETRRWYKAIKKVYCPAIRADVVFNSKGFHHLLYDGTGTRRPTLERIMRLKLVRYAPTIIESALDITWKRKENNTEYVIFIKQIKHDELGSVLLRLVVVMTAGGNYFYYSIMDDYIS